MGLWRCKRFVESAEAKISPGPALALVESSFAMARASLIPVIVLLTSMALMQGAGFALPDAAIVRIAATGSDLHEGDQVPISIEVANRGDAPLPPTSVVLSLNDKQYAAWKTPEILSPHATATWSLTWSAVRGSVVMLATIDPLNDVIESDESNNSNFISLGVGEVRPPSPWPPALAGLGAFLLGVIIALAFQRLRPKPRPEQQYAARRPSHPKSDIPPSPPA